MKITLHKTLLHQYNNGNYTVKIYSDGTKIRESTDDKFNSEFPENIDLKVTNKCKIGCPFCHENSLSTGLPSALSHPFLDTLVAGTELAIGGGDIFELDNTFEVFLEARKKQGVICNVTVNQKSLYNQDNIKRLNNWIENNFVYGVGISYDKDPISLEAIMWQIKKPENVVVHVINGIHCLDDLQYFNDDYMLKVLILGYKKIGRGLSFLETKSSEIESQQRYLQFRLKDYLENGFEVLSFDNLALSQLDVKGLVKPDYWTEHYMGDDGSHTMYIDLVTQEFASSSTSPIRYSLDNYTDIKNIFKVISEEAN